MNRVIVTGGTGFIGKRMVEYLIKRKKEVIMIVRDKKKISNDLINKVCAVSYDETDKLPTSDVFIHLAWGGCKSE